MKDTGLAAGLLAGPGILFWYARRPETAAAPIRVEPRAVRLPRGKDISTLADCDGCYSEGDFSRFGGPVVTGRRGVGPRPRDGHRRVERREKTRAILEGVDRSGRGQKSVEDGLHPLAPGKHAMPGGN